VPPRGKGASICRRKAAASLAKCSKQKAAGIFALRLAGFENLWL
jgi:hypothetical protein